MLATRWAQSHVPLLVMPASTASVPPERIVALEPKVPLALNDAAMTTSSRLLMPIPLTVSFSLVPPDTAQSPVPL